MPREHQNRHCSSQMEDVQTSNPSSIAGQTSVRTKKLLGKDDTPDVNQSGLKKDTKKKKKRADTCGGDGTRQHENVNMNKQYDAPPCGKETTPLSQRDVSSQSCVFGDKPDGQNCAKESIAGSKLHTHTVKSARSKLSSTKSQMKKLVTSKVTVYEPKKVELTSADADINMSKSITVHTNSEALISVSKKHKTPSHGGKSNNNNSLNIETTNSVPLVDAENETDYSETSTTTEVNPNTGISQVLKLTNPSKSTNRNRDPAKLKTNHSKSTSEDMKTPEKDINMNIEKAQKQDRIQPLSKQGTFLIEKPKLAWSSPAMRSRYPHRYAAMDCPLQSSSSVSPLQVETLVTSLQSPNRVTQDSDEDDQNKEDNQASGIVHTSRARNEQSKSLHNPPRMLQSYSNSSEDDSDNDCAIDVVGDTMDKDSEDDSEEDVVKADEDSCSPWKRKSSNIHYEPLSWVITTNNKDVPSLTNEPKVSQDQDIESKSRPTEQTKKVSKLKKIKKSFAKLPKGISENFLNILPSTSIFFNMPKFKGSRVGKINVTDIPADNKESKSTNMKPEVEAGAKYETVTMRHASMQTNRKKT